MRQPSEEAIAELRAVAERQLSAEEISAAVNTPISDEERAETESLIDWFTRRYPTPEARLAYVRRAYTRWARRRA